MDIYESPQPSTSEAEDIVEDSEAEFSNQLPQGDTNGCSQNSNAIPSPELLPLPKPKVKRHKRPPDPSDPVVIAAQAAAAAATAEAEEAERLLLLEATKMSTLENLKYYTSLVLGTLCIVNVFAFLFLVPFVLDPAISTLRHRFVENPVTCKVTNVSVKQGKSQCLWSSCREGCTSDMFQCYQVRVQYIDQDYKNNTAIDEFHESTWKNLSRYDNLENETRIDTPLLVNIKGCGYPPEISCPAFANHFNEIFRARQTFPCHYSKENPWIVLQNYDYKKTMGKIVGSIMIPNVIFAVSLLILLYWYCPYCQARCKKYEDQIDQEVDQEKTTADPCLSPPKSPKKRY